MCDFSLKQPARNRISPWGYQLTKMACSTESLQPDATEVLSLKPVGFVWHKTYMFRSWFRPKTKKNLFEGCQVFTHDSAFFAGSAKAFGNRSHLMLITCTWRLDPRPAAHGDNSSHWQKKRWLKKTSICLSVLLGYLECTLSIYTYYLYVHAIYIYSEMVEFWFWNMSGHSSWNLSTTSGKAHRNRHRNLHHKHYEHWKRALAACTDTHGGCKSSWCGKQCSMAAMEQEVKGV